jgi:hypothetical protein
VDYAGIGAQSPQCVERSGKVERPHGPVTAERQCGRGGAVPGLEYEGADGREAEIDGLLIEADVLAVVTEDLQVTEDKVNIRALVV